MGRLTDALFARVRDDADPAAMVGFPTAGNGMVPYGVSTTTATGLSAVWRCLDVLGTGVSQLPWREHRGTLGLPLSRLTRRPSAFYTRREWVQLVVRTMALFDVSYLLKLGPEDAEGVPMGLWPIPPTIIIPKAVDAYTLTPPQNYVVGRTTVSADNIVVIRRGPLPGVPDYLAGMLNLARATFAGAIAAENYAARYWQAGGSPVTVLETDANLSDPQATSLGNRWANRRQQGSEHPAVLSNGLKARPYGADPSQQSAVEARRDISADVARYFGIPSKLANVPSMDSQTYKSSQEENIDLLHYTLENYIGAVEDAVTDLLPGGREMSMDRTGLTEGTQLARFQAYQLATGAQPWMTPADVREAEGMPPMELVPPMKLVPGMPDDDSQRPLQPIDVNPTQAIIAATTGRPAA